MWIGATSSNHPSDAMISDSGTSRCCELISCVGKAVSHAGMQICYSYRRRLLESASAARIWNTQSRTYGRRNAQETHTYEYALIIRWTLNTTIENSYRPCNWHANFKTNFGASDSEHTNAQPRSSWTKCGCVNQIINFIGIYLLKIIFT